MNTPNQGACQSRKTKEKCVNNRQVANFPSQQLARNPTPRLGTFATRPALMRSTDRRSFNMIGKLFGAWLGEKVAGKNEGAKGAILGYGTAALAKRSIPTLAALALGGWAFKKWRDKRRAQPSYPAEASPSS
jgi:hypothetical protein